MGLVDYIRGFKAKYGPLLSDKRFIAGEVALVIAVNLFRWIEPFGTLILGWVSLWLRGKTWRDVGLVNPKSWRRTLLVSAVFLVLVVVFTVGISGTRRIDG